ncbi:MAG: ribonuclease P protein component [Bacteroidetes bacterium]|nr:MAG: ribonuclease P protein component [Bacteroidota bacterium]
MTKAQGLGKKARLHGQKTIGLLFEKGSSFTLFPFRVSWMVSDTRQAEAAEMGVAVPKRNFKRAVKRNLLKRRMREAYRKNRNEFCGELVKRGASVKMMILFTAREPLEYKEIEGKIILTLQRLLKEYDAGKGRIRKENEPRG